MKMKPIKTVDSEAIQRVLEEQRGTVAEIVLRFAWCMGLIPDEMHEVKWNDIDFELGVVRLSDRDVPMDEATRACLENRYRKPSSKRSEYVLITELRRLRMSRAYIFRCAKTALEVGGVHDVTLMDLRHDFIAQQLKQHSKPYVAKIAGVTIATLDAFYAQYAKPKNKKADRPAVVKVDTERLAEFIMKKPLAPERLALWMIWKQKLTVKDLTNLTWEQVDTETSVIQLENRKISVDSMLREWLCQLCEARGPGCDSHVLLTPRSGKPFDMPRLSRVTRAALIKAGLDQITLFDLMHEETDSTLLRYAEENGPITRAAAMELLQTTKAAAWERLHRLVEEGQLVRVGAKYYRAGTVVPPEEQYEVIRAHLEEVGGAYRQELAELLQVETKQCTWLLREFVTDGRLQQVKQRYSLPKEYALK